MRFSVIEEVMLRKIICFSEDKVVKKRSWIYENEFERMRGIIGNLQNQTKY